MGETTLRSMGEQQSPALMLAAALGVHGCGQGGGLPLPPEANPAELPCVQIGSVADAGRPRASVTWAAPRSW